MSTVTGRLCIGLAGKAGSGKSTLAKHWHEKYGFSVVSFAGPVKDVTKMLMLEPTRVNHQLVGDGLRQLVGGDVWTNIMVKRIYAAFKKDRVVVDDVRYPNEVKLLRSLGFMIVWLERPEEGRLRDRPEMADPAVREHPSEKLSISADDLNLAISVENVAQLVIEGDRFVEGMLAAQPMLSQEEMATKGEIIRYLRTIIEREMKVILADPISDDSSPLAILQDGQKRQKAERIVIQAIKAMSSPNVGLKGLKQKNIMDILKENEAATNCGK